MINHEYSDKEIDEAATAILSKMDCGIKNAPNHIGDMHKARAARLVFRLSLIVDMLDVSKQDAQELGLLGLSSKIYAAYMELLQNRPLFISDLSQFDDVAPDEDYRLRAEDMLILGELLVDEATAKLQMSEGR